MSISGFSALGVLVGFVIGVIQILGSAQRGSADATGD
jgi:hypothetical protein